MAAITLEHIRVVYAGDRVAIPDLTLDIADGERLVLVGASGSGKSTVLRVIAGLEYPAGGRVSVGGRDVTSLAPEHRDLAMVFQSYALYPHMSVRANLGFGLRMRGLAEAEIRRRVETTAESLGITSLFDRLPAQLSGGERQRVALGRAIVRQPLAFLFDEPLSNLDPRLRGDLRAELVRLHNRLQATMVYVTHDQEEAMTLGQRIAVLRQGRLEQVGTPQEVYDSPVNTFVASFIGSPPMNVLPVAAIGRAAGPAHQIGIRPHDVALGEAGGPGLRARIEVVEPLGHARIVHINLDNGHRMAAVVPNETSVRAGDHVAVALPIEKLHLFDDKGLRLEFPRLR